MVHITLRRRSNLWWGRHYKLKRLGTTQTQNIIVHILIWICQLQMYMPHLTSAPGLRLVSQVAECTQQHHPDDSGYMPHTQTYTRHSQTLAGAACTLDTIQVKGLSSCRGLYNRRPGTSPDLEVLCLQCAQWSCQSAPGRTCCWGAHRDEISLASHQTMRKYTDMIRSTLEDWLR